MISAANHVPLTPLSFLARPAGLPGKVAVVDSDETPVSYAELGLDCGALAGALRADGCSRVTGSRARLSSAGCWPRTSRYPARRGAGRAEHAAGRQRVPGHPGHSRAKILLVSGELLPRLEVRRPPSSRRAVVLLPGTPRQRCPALQLRRVGHRPGRLGIMLPDDEDAMIAVNYTSGTTGRPKGVVYTTAAPTSTRSAWPWNSSSRRPAACCGRCRCFTATAGR